MSTVVLYCHQQTHVTNRLIANAIASFVFAFVVIDTAVALFRVQNAERQQYLQSRCWEDAWGCGGRIHLFDFLDGEILAYSATGASLIGVGFSSLLLNKNPRQNPKAKMMYVLSATLFSCYVVYYETFSYAQSYWAKWPGQLIPLKNLYCCFA